TLAPNVFSIYLHSQDYDRFSSWQDTLLDELQRVLMEHAEKQRYMFVGGVSVTLERDDEVRAGRFETASRPERGSGAPATGAAAATPTSSSRPPGSRATTSSCAPSPMRPWSPPISAPPTAPSSTGSGSAPPSPSRTAPC